MKSKNGRILTTIFIVVGGMIALSFASVPLYKIFCRVTGFDGTVQVSEKAPPPDQIIDRVVTVKFNADVSRNMLWSFHSDKRQIDVKLGQQGLISFSAENKDRVPVTGVAVYNVTPPKAGKYFHKTQCFCFGQQSLNPGEKADYTVI
ncbi:MAG TPA: cytochrome c oxidase assembly protein, partial [Micavibrio sp.]